MKPLQKLLLSTCLLTLGGVSNLFAVHIIVAVKPVAPFVFVSQDGKFSGYSIDLWKEVAEESGLTDYEFQNVGTVPAMIDALKTGKADVGVGALSITADRAKQIDFSHPFYDSGLDIMVKGSGTPGLLDILGRVFTPSFNEFLLGVVGCVFVFACIVWIIERRKNHEDFPHHWLQGLHESLWWTGNVLLCGSCMNKDPKSFFGRAVGAAWAVIGIGIMLYIAGTVTSTMTVDSLNSDINGLKDLNGKVIATISGSSAEKYLTSLHLNVVGFPKIEDAVAALEKDKVKAVVYDSPIMMYYLANNDTKDMHLVGKLFEKQKYGFGLQPNSKLRQQINSGLLSVEESEFPDKLDKIYFAPPAQ